MSVALPYPIYGRDAATVTHHEPPRCWAQINTCLDPDHCGGHSHGICNEIGYPPLLLCRRHHEVITGRSL